MSKNQLDYTFCPSCAGMLDIRIEEGKERKYCRECRWTYYPTPHIASVAVITKTDERHRPCVLMVRRKREPFAGTWMFPSGFLEFGEHPEEDTLPRETREEVGLTVTGSRLIKIIKATKDSRSPYHLVFFYETRASGNIKNNDEDENSDIQWKPLTENVDIGFPHQKEIFLMLRRTQRSGLYEE